MKPLSPKYPGSEAVDEVDHAMDLIRVARLGLREALNNGVAGETANMVAARRTGGLQS